MKNSYNTAKKNESNGRILDNTTKIVKYLAKREGISRYYPLIAF